MSNKFTQPNDKNKSPTARHRPVSNKISKEFNPQLKPFFFFLNSPEIGLQLFIFNLNNSYKNINLYEYIKKSSVKKVLKSNQTLT